MKNAPTKTLVLLSTALLTSCGGNQPGSSDATKDTYFEAYKTSSKAGFDSGAFSIETENLQFQAGAKIKADEEEEYSFSCQSTGFPFKVAAKGFKEESIADVTAYAALNSAGITINTDLTAVGLSLSKLEPKLYLQDSTFYVDTSKNKTLGTAIQALVREIPGNETWKYPSSGKGKIGLDSEDADAIDEIIASYSEEYDIEAVIDSALDFSVDLMESAYASDPTTFTFSENAGAKKIAFVTRDAAVIKDVAKNMVEERAGEEEEFDKEEFEANLDKAFEGMEFDKLRYEVSFNNEGLVSKDVYFHTSFDEAAFRKAFPDSSVYPVGEYVFKGSFAYAFGASVDVPTVPNPSEFEDFPPISIELE